MRVFTRRGVAILLATTSIGMCAEPARAEDAARFKAEAQMQRLESGTKTRSRPCGRRSGNCVVKSRQRRWRRPRRRPLISRAAGPGISPGAEPGIACEGAHDYDRGYHFGFSDATGDNTVELLGRLQLDTGGYTNYNPAPRRWTAKDFGWHRSAPGAHRRHRYLHDRLALRLCLRPRQHSRQQQFQHALASANSSTSPTTSNNFLSGIENAFLTYNGFYSHASNFLSRSISVSWPCRGRSKKPRARTI